MLSMQSNKNRRMSRSYRTNRKAVDTTVVRRVIVAVIVILVVVVGVALASVLLLNPKRLATNKIEEMAKEYYEEFTYDGLVENVGTGDELREAMEKYTTRGFASVSLRQLLLYDNQKNLKDGGFLREMCDENTTSVKFYPEEPFDRHSYRIEYKLDCDFDK